METINDDGTSRFSCVICYLEIKRVQQPIGSGAPFLYECPRCGKYGTARDPFDRRLLVKNVAEEWRACLGAYTRQANIRGKNAVLDERWIEEAIHHRDTPFALRPYKLLGYLGSRSDTPGSDVELVPSNDYTVCDARNAGELAHYMRHLESEGLLTRHDKHSPYTVRVTMSGWEKLQPSSRSGAIPNTAFVACAFQPEIEEAYFRAIKPTLENLGYAVRCMLEIKTTEGITDRILAEIRQAEVTVADFTYQRQGVYFEAGFAKGLGRHVIWSCRADDLKNAHFDTRHLGHVVWATHEELIDELTIMIRANIIRSI